MPYPSSIMDLLPKPRMGGAGTIASPGTTQAMQSMTQANDPIYGGDDVDMQKLLELLAAKQGGGGEMGAGTAGLDWNMQNLDLLTRNGVTLQPEAMRVLMQARKRFDIPILSMIGGSYRDVATQRDLYNQWVSGQRNIQAAPPGKSYHNYGLAFDLSQQLPAVVQNFLERQGWQNTVPGEWWHWSYGDAPWGGS